MSVNRKDDGLARREAEAFSGHRLNDPARESPEAADPQTTGPADKTSKAVRRLLVAFRRAAALTERHEDPAAVSAETIGSTSRIHPFPTTQTNDDEHVVAKVDGRSPHWPWPSAVEAVSGELASKLRPEVPANEAPSRELFGRLPRVLAGFVIGLLISWIVLSIYPIHTEVHDVVAANTPPSSDRTTTAASTNEVAVPVQTGPPNRELSAPLAAIPSVPLGLVVETARGREDTAIPLAIGTTRISSQEAKNLAITITGLPEGARLSAGQEDAADRWTLRPDQLSGLTLVPPGNYSGRFELSVSAAFQNADIDRQAVTKPLAVNVSGVADLPSLAVEDATGSRGRPIPLVLDAALADGDGSESLSVVITGAPEGTVFSAGSGDGEDAWVLASNDLEGLTLRPAAGFSGRLDLTFAATALEVDGDSATATAPLTVKVSDATEHLALSVEDVSAVAGRPVRLEIGTALNSSEAAEHFSISIAGLPQGARLSAGRDLGGGKWVLSPSQLADLILLPPAGYSGNFELRVAATAGQKDGGIVTATAPLAVSVITAPETPDLTTADTLGAEAKSLSLIKGDPVVAVVAGPDSSLAPRPQRLAQTEAKDFMARGNQFLELGDIAAARLFYELALDHGEVRAATAVAKTFDPLYLRERGVLGAKGNPDMAMRWYKRAIEAGDLEAVTRLKALAN